MTGDLRARLNRLQQSGELGGAAKQHPSRNAAGNFLFPGQENEFATPAGFCYAREIKLALDFRYGPEPLSRILELWSAGLPLPQWAGAFEKAGPESSLFVDIETTGLCGGTGTWVFMIGMGWFEGVCFRLRQYFLRQLSEEKAMLYHFTEAASNHGGLVTFNGKAFDLPLIRTRQLIAGAPTGEPPEHLDLLHCSRRLFKERLQSCSLRRLEEELLGLSRRDDIPGEEIPSVYFNYLRRGETARLKQVFRHNLLDILAMAALLGRIVKTGAGIEIEHAADYYSLGRLCLQAGQPEKAVSYFEKAAGSGNARLAESSSLELAMICKRQGNWQRAVETWSELARRGSSNLEPYIELAKYHEHRSGNLPQALSLARCALNIVRSDRGQQPLYGEQGISALEHRINRLCRKLKLK